MIAHNQSRDCVETLSEFLNWDENNKNRRKSWASSRLLANTKTEVGDNISHRKNYGLLTQSVAAADPSDDAICSLRFLMESLEKLSEEQAGWLNSKPLGSSNRAG